MAKMARTASLRNDDMATGWKGKLRGRGAEEGAKRAKRGGEEKVPGGRGRRPKRANGTLQGRERASFQKLC